MGIQAVTVVASVARPPAKFVFLKNGNQAPGKFYGHFTKVHPLAAASRAFHFEFIFEIFVVLMQGIVLQVVHRKPYRPTPVGIEKFFDPFTRNHLSHYWMAK